MGTRAAVGQSAALKREAKLVRPSVCAWELGRPSGTWIFSPFLPALKRGATVRSSLRDWKLPGFGPCSPESGSHAHPPRVDALASVRSSATGRGRARMAHVL